MWQNAIKKFRPSTATLAWYRLCTESGPSDVYQDSLEYPRLLRCFVGQDSAYYPWLFPGQKANKNFHMTERKSKDDKTELGKQ